MLGLLALTRILISFPLVAQGVGIANKEVAVSTQHGMNGEALPQDAWRAADAAFDSPEWSPDTDDLTRALAAASPYIRTDELDQHIEALMQKLADTPLLGRKNNGVRAGLDEAIQLLIERRNALLKGSLP